MFNNIAADHRDAMAAQPALVMRADFIKEKMALMALLNLVFERPSHERNIPFADIMARVKIPLDQVEWLIMRAMSLGLIRGLMDEVEQLVHVSWVQPRVLDNDQLRHLSLRLDDWKKRVDTALLHIEEQTPELFA
jgi:26S proteasome regulatory subunit N9